MLCQAEWHKRDPGEAPFSEGDIVGFNKRVKAPVLHYSLKLQMGKGPDGREAFRILARAKESGRQRGEPG